MAKTFSTLSVNPNVKSNGKRWLPVFILALSVLLSACGSGSSQDSDADRVTEPPVDSPPDNQPPPTSTPEPNPSPVPSPEPSPNPTGLWEKEENQCAQHLLPGLPSDVDQVLCREGFAVGYRYDKRQADWVSYYVTAESVAKSHDRNDRFREDGEIPSAYRARLSDYKYSGYSRGHLAPRATVDMTYNAMDESFLLSNISPQVQTFNGGGWLSLEDNLRHCVADNEALYIVTGTFFDGKTVAYANGQLEVPSHFYKAILKPSEPYAAWAVVMPHEKLPKDLRPYVLSIDALEQITGRDFFANLSDSIEVGLEKHVHIRCPVKGSELEATDVNFSADLAKCQTKRCAGMHSCEEARFYFESCRATELDEDQDGMPCDTLCDRPWMP